jgi:Protein of unknown function (DUF3570)
MRGRRQHHHRAAAAALAAAFALFAPRLLNAEDRVSFRGAYFREASNRVIQPMMELTKDLPGGYDVGGHLLVDAISSASIAQGAAVDDVFTENRYEGSIGMGITRDLQRLAGFIRYSSEPDYKSLTFGLSLNREVWDRTGTVGVNVAFSHDDIQPPPPQTDKALNVWFAGVGYTQALTPTTLGQLVYETYLQSGFLANPYLAHGSLGREDVPNKRQRHAIAARIAQYLPPATLGVQAHYRLYYDQLSLFETGPWGILGHTLEGRLSKALGPNVELRGIYRFHTQSAASFWCNTNTTMGGDISCYGMSPEYHSVDIKFGDLRTQVAEFKLIWDMRLLSGTALDFFAAGTFDVSYGYYFEGTPYGQEFTDRNAPPVIGELPFSREYGGAHLIQTGYSLPF